MNGIRYILGIWLLNSAMRSITMGVGLLRQACKGGYHLRRNNVGPCVFCGAANDR